MEEEEEEKPLWNESLTRFLLEEFTPNTSQYYLFLCFISLFLLLLGNLPERLTFQMK